MFTLREDLSAASWHGRLGIAASLVDGLCGGDARAAHDYWYLVHGLLNDEILPEESPRGASMPGEFTAAKSADLMLETARLQGFGQAISRSDQATAAIDAGTGSTAVLAFITAIRHPKAEVFAYEINPRAANCARRVIELFGLSVGDRVQVFEADVLTTRLPNVDLAVTETFDSGLLVEKGPLITAALGKVARTVLPATADIFAADISTDRLRAKEPLWQAAGRVNLTAHSGIVSGEITATQRAPRASGIQQLLRCEA